MIGLGLIMIDMLVLVNSDFVVKNWIMLWILMLCIGELFEIVGVVVFFVFDDVGYVIG